MSEVRLSKARFPRTFNVRAHFNTNISVQRHNISLNWSVDRPHARYSQAVTERPHTIRALY
jgi:hypothetical protein